MSKLTLLAASVILQNITNISKRTDSLDTAVHETAIQCMLHAQEHGDVMLADRLIKTLGGRNKNGAIKAAVKAGHEPFKPGRMTGYNVRGLEMWFIRYSPIYWSSDGKPGLLKAGMGLYDQLLNRNEGKPWNTEAAANSPFWTLPEVRREVERQPFTLETVNTIVVNLKERVNKSVGAGTFMGDKQAAMDYIDALAKVPVPQEDETRVILPTAPNIKGTTYAGNQPEAQGKAGAEPNGLTPMEENGQKVEAPVDAKGEVHQEDNRGDVKVA